MSPSSETVSVNTPLPDSNWLERDRPISFRRMIAVEPHLDNTTNSSTAVFTSISSSYPPTPVLRSYGGSVFAQAAWAAANTVPFGMHIHSMTGYFLEIGDVRYAFRYVVRKVRTGGVYAIRSVEVYQYAGAAAEGKPDGALCFVGTAGFKRDETGKHKGQNPQRRSFEHQAKPRDWLEKEYGEVLGKKHAFEEWPLCQGMDGLWTTKLNVAQWKQRGDAFPGLDMRKVDMRGYNADPRIISTGGAQGGDDGKAAREWTQLLLYRLLDDGEELSRNQESSKNKTGGDDIINLHACAHIYASDRNSLFLAQRALGFHNTRGQMGTLSFTFNFHGHAKDWLMVDEKTGKPKEYVQENWVSNSGGDRVTLDSRLWDKASGRVIATTVQDGMMRIPTKTTTEMVDGDAIVRREAKL